MPVRSSVPDALIGCAFTTAEARRLGVTSRMLSGARFVQLHHGVWRLATTPSTPSLTTRAALLAAPTGSAISHVTALEWMLDPESVRAPVHLSVHGTLRGRIEDVVVHRRKHPFASRMVEGLPCLGPERTFVDCGVQLGLRGLVAAGDQLVRRGWTTVDRLIAYADEHHLDGVVRAREAARLVRPRVDSVRETDVRLLLAAAGMPEPETNIDVLDDAGRWVARGDLVLNPWKVLVEHDRWVHERDARQRQKDHLRRERIQAAGWSLVVVTVQDFRRPVAIVARVHAAMVARGYRGPRPQFGASWARICRGLD